MSRFTEEMKVVPTTARVVAVFAYLGMVCVLGATVLYANDPELARSPTWAKALLVFAPGIVLAMLVLLIGYVYGDAKRRGCAMCCGRCLRSSFRMRSGLSCISFCATRRRMRVRDVPRW